MALLHYYVRRVNFTKFQALFVSKNSLHMHSLCMGNLATFNFYRRHPQSQILIFLNRLFLLYQSVFRPHETSESTHRSCIFLKALSSVDLFLDPTDLVNLFGRLKTGNFWIQQRPKLASKLKWKMTALPSAYLHLLDTARLTLDFLQVDLW